MHTSRIVANLKILPVYTCDVCDTCCEGTTLHMEIDCLNADDLARYIRIAPLRSHDMPYGWSYDGRFTCNVCMAERASR